MTYFECVFVALDIQHAMSMRHVSRRFDTAGHSTPVTSCEARLILYGSIMGLQLSQSEISRDFLHPHCSRPHY